MDTKDATQKYSPNMDTQAVILGDVAGDMLIKVYPYLLPNTKKGDAFISSNSTSIVYYTQLGLDDEDLLMDENGNYYFEMLPSLTTLTTLDLGAGTSQFHQELSEIPSFQGLSNYYPKKIKNKLTLLGAADSYDFTPIVFSFATPLDEDKWNQGILPLFIAASHIPAMDSESDLSQAVDKEGLYETRFMNVTSLEQQFMNSAIKFTDRVNTRDVKTLSIAFPTNGLFGGIDGKTQIGDRLTDLSIKESKSYPIINAAPNEITNRVEMFFKWFDTKLTLPIHIMQKFETATTLSTLFKDDAGTWLPDGEDLYALTKDMLLYTKLYINSWADISDGDKLSDASNANYGAVKGNITLGALNAPATYGVKKKVINLLVGKDPAAMINSLYETFLNHHPDINQTTLAIFKAGIIALSRYVASANLALGGGVNDFNSIYLPWRLRTTNILNITRTGIGGGYNYSLTEDPLVIFNSHWFELNGGVVTAKKSNNLYETQLIQSERNITQPLIPDVLRPLNLVSNPAGVNINSDNELKYNWLITSTDQKVIDSLYLKELVTVLTEPMDITINDESVKLTRFINQIEINAFIKDLPDMEASLPTTDTPSIIAIRAKAADANINTVSLLRIYKNFINNITDSLGFAKSDIATIKAGPQDFFDIDSRGYDDTELLWIMAKFFKDILIKNEYTAINHRDQWNGSTFTSSAVHEVLNGRSILQSVKYIFDNWLREFEGSWLWKYLDSSTYAEFVFRLIDVADALFHSMTDGNGDDWNVKAQTWTKAQVAHFFPGIADMDLTFLTLSIDGYRDATVLKRGQAILSMEGIEKVYGWRPSNMILTLKVGANLEIDLSKDRKLIYTKDEWHGLIRTLALPAYEKIDLTPIKGDDLGSPTELDIIAMWHNNLILSIDGIDINIESINEYDETVTRQRIIFT